MELLDKLKSGETNISSLSEDYGIKVREYPDRYVLNYDQVDSSKFRFHPIVRVCRNLIVSKDFNKVLHRSFDRFFNYGEDPAAAEFDFSKAVCEEKLDGSLVGLYHDGDKWCHCTRSLAYGEGNLNSDIKYKTFAELIDNEVDLTPVYYNGNKKYSYIFELMSQFDPHVTRPADTKMYLLAVRNKETGEYVDKHVEGERIGWKYYPKESSFHNYAEIKEIADKMPLSEEGFVCRIGDWRIKVKSPAHIAAFVIRSGGLTEEKVINLVNLHEETEYLSYYPDEKKYFIPWIQVRDNMEKNFNFIYKMCKDEVRKTFSMNLDKNNIPSVMKTVLFKMYENGGRFEDAFKSIPETKIVKLYLGVKELFAKGE